MIKFLNFGKILLEPPENGNTHVSLAKGGAYPLMPSEIKTTIIIKNAERKLHFFKNFD